MKKKYYSGRDIERLLAVIKRNKEKNLSNSRQEYDGLYSENSSYSSNAISNSDTQSQQAQEIGPQDVKLVLFGAESPFLTSITEMFSSLIVITAFNDPEKTVCFVLEYHIRHVVVDLDSPTDPYESINIFSALKTLVPEMNIYACTKNPQRTEACELKCKGAVILPKPLWRRQIEEFVKRYL